MEGFATTQEKGAYSKDLRALSLKVLRKCRRVDHVEMDGVDIQFIADFDIEDDPDFIALFGEENDPISYCMPAFSTSDEDSLDAIPVGFVLAEAYGTLKGNGYCLSFLQPTDFYISDRRSDSLDYETDDTVWLLERTRVNNTVDHRPQLEKVEAQVNEHECCLV